MGATFLHRPGKGNAIYDYVISTGLKTIEAPTDDEFFYEGRGRLD